MNSQGVNRSVNIYINDIEAEKSLNNLKEKSEKLTKAIKDGEAAGKDMTKSIEKLAAVNGKMEMLQQVVDGKIRPSFRMMQQEVQRLERELSNMSEDAPGYAAKFDEFQKKSEIFNEMKLKVNDAKGAIDGMSASVLTIVKVFAGNLLADFAENVLGSIGAVIANLFSLRSELEKAVNNLSAITGATGKDLEYLKQEAISLSKEGKQSVLEYVEAMKLIASAKPELLSHKEDLVEVTRAAKLLADASGLELPEAATKLTDALNQYGAPAEEATKYVDALAAASKYGAAEVPELTDALLKFGTLAKSNNINIYESAGAIELLAEKGLKGADAGTQLRNVLLRLSAVEALPPEAIARLNAAGVNTDILKDKTLSLETRLKELGKIQNDTTAMVKVFGAENLNAGQIILQNIPRYAELTRSIKEQGVAASQAAVNTDNLENSWEKFKNLLSSYFLEGSNAPLKKAVDLLSVSAQGLHDIFIKVGQSLSDAFTFGKNLLSVMGDIVQAKSKWSVGLLDGIGVSDDDEKRAKITKELADSKAYAAKVVKDATTLDIKEREKLLEQNKALKESSFQAYDQLVKAGKQFTIEGHKAARQLYEDGLVVMGLQKNINDAKKAAQTTADSNNSGNDADAKAAALAKAEAAEKKAEAKRQSLKKDLEKIREEMGKMAIEIRSQQLPQYEQDLAKINEKYDTLVAKLKKVNASAKDIANAEKLRNDEKLFLEKTYNKKFATFLTEQDDKRAEARMTAYEKELNDLEKLYEKEHGVLKDDYKTQIALYFDLLHRKKQVRLDFEDKESEQRFKDFTENLPKMFPKATLQISPKLTKPKPDDKERLAEWIALFKKQFGKAIDFAQQFGDVVNRIEDLQVEKSRANTDKQIAYYQNMLDQKMISQEEYDQKVKEIKKQQFEKEKKAQLIQAGISGAQAVMKTLEQNGPPVPWNIPGVIAMGLTLGSTLAQILAITSSEAPEYAQGGNLPNSGVMEGPSHAQGGMHVVDSRTGQVKAVVEGGEPIYSKRFYRNNKALMDSLMSYSHATKGAPLTVDWMNAPVASINAPQIVSKISGMRKFASGGILPGGGNNAGSGFDPRFMTTFFTQMQTLFSQPIKAYTVLSEHQAQKSRMDEIRQAGTIK